MGSQWGAPIPPHTFHPDHSAWSLFTRAFSRNLWSALCLHLRGLPHHSRPCPSQPSPELGTSPTGTGTASVLWERPERLAWLREERRLQLEEQWGRVRLRGPCRTWCRLCPKSREMSACLLGGERTEGPRAEAEP